MTPTQAILLALAVGAGVGTSYVLVTWLLGRLFYK
jgi:hypothetical protein